MYAIIINEKGNALGKKAGKGYIGGFGEREKGRNK